jgi:hypothetical protein
MQNILLLLPFLMACQTTTTQQQQILAPKQQQSSMHHDAVNASTSANTLVTRFATPKGFQREQQSQGSFGYYLQNLPLKNDTCLVRYYNGSYKPNNDVYAAVVALPIGTSDLHQCADAVMYLRAKYLYDTKQYKQIGFRFLGDTKMHWYTDFCGSDYSSKTFFKYMQDVWRAANTRSLHGQLIPKTLDSASIGDVFIVTGNPYGHAVIIVDECVNATTGQKMFVLAQSYMPAQETQILLNPNVNEKTVWYSFDDVAEIITPEWTFPRSALRTW